jgi:hypothetical protein
MRRRKQIATGVAMFALCSLATGPALAAPPTRTIEHVDETFPSRLSEQCGFDVLLRLKGTIRTTEFVDRNGELTRALTTYPGLFYTFINAETGESVTSRSPDPEHITVTPDGSTTITVTGLVMHVVVPGSGVVAAQAGRFVITVSADGEASESEPVGRSDDYHAAVCEVLAP